MIRLITNYYEDSSKARQAELDLCIDENRQSFTQAGGIVHILRDDVVGRPTFQKFFEVANAMAGDDDVTVIANTDIRFPVDALAMMEQYMRPELCMALTRWDTPRSKHPPEDRDGPWAIRQFSNSQDAWVFKGKIRIPKKCDFHLGIPGCDNRIAWELYMANYKMVNPCKSIQTFHHHECAKRNGRKSDTIPKPYCYISHITIDEIDNKQQPRNEYHLIMEV